MLAGIFFMIDSKVFSEIYKKDSKRLCWLLAKGLGIGRYNEAEDAVQEAFTLAFENWNKTGLPDNPTAWVYKVAKNLVLQRIRSNKEIGLDDIEERQLATSFPSYTDNEASKLDGQIEVAFACCNPALPVESQIALVLKTLFGFSVQEVADALLVNYDTVEKRLQRARKLAREIEIKPELPQDFEDRLPPLLRTIYLIFNEGYYSKGAQQTRFLLCTDAISLLRNLVEHKSGLFQKSEIYALLALFCFHAARFDARSTLEKEPILLENQDPSLWNQRLIGFGDQFLNKASTGTVITHYHIEAAIAGLHTRIYLPETEKWKQVALLYKQLLNISDTLLARISLNVAVFKSGELTDAFELWENNYILSKDNYFFQILGFQLYKSLNKPKNAKECIDLALKLAKSDTERSHALQLLNN